MAKIGAELRKLKQIVLHVWQRLKIAIPAVMGVPDTGRLRSRHVLSREIELRFSLDELEGLIVDLGIDQDNIAGDTKEEKVRNLLLYFMHRHIPFAILMDALKTSRPKVQWPDVSNLE